MNSIRQGPHFFSQAIGFRTPFVVGIRMHVFIGLVLNTCFNARSHKHLSRACCELQLIISHTRWRSTKKKRKENAVSFPRSFFFLSFSLFFPPHVPIRWGGQQQQQQRQRRLSYKYCSSFCKPKPWWRSQSSQETIQSTCREEEKQQRMCSLRPSKWKDQMPQER